MIDRKQAIEMCLQLEDAYEDYPFYDFNWTVMRHRNGNKSFAYIYNRNGKLFVNVKATPQMGQMWRSAYPAITAGYHMNKQHWLTLPLDGSLDQSIVLQLICESFNLTKGK